MMREILFRAKAIHRAPDGEYRTAYKNGDWVYGLITKLRYPEFPELPAEMTNQDGVSGIEVDYDTLGQYTGLTDKNGVRIFEGDIVVAKIRGVRFAKINPGIIRYTDGAFWIYKSNMLHMLVKCDSYENIEVISNIHDNPALLGEQKP